MREAKNNLSKYGNIAHHGETVVASKNGKPWFDIVPHHKAERKTGPLPNVKPTITAEEAIAPMAKDFLHSVELPAQHQDPFDRIIITQSHNRNRPVLTFDPMFVPYGIQITY